MYSSSIRHARRSSSLISLLARGHGSRPFSAFPAKAGSQESSGDGSKSSNFVRRNISPLFGGLCGRSGLGSSIMRLEGNVTAPYALTSLSSIHSDSRKDFLSGGRNAMNFVRDIIEEDDNNNRGNPRQPRYSIERNADIVHVKLMRNNSFVTVTDPTGKKKFGASLGSVPGLKGSKQARYSGEAVAEHVGRVSKNLGLKSVVVKVKGFTHFKRKKQAIMSWREGYNDSRTDRNPIVYIEDTTRKAHNGCRLPKRRRN